MPHRIQNITSNNRTLKFNICGFLTCNGYTNASICMEKNGIESVYGWNNETIIQNNKNLEMEIFGEEDNFVKINFKCAYSETKQGKVELVDNGSELIIDFYTMYACPNMDVKNNSCVFKSDNSTFDLSPLILLNDNYKILDEKDDLIYTINVCRPVVHTLNSSCGSYSTVCRYNSSEPDVRKR